MMAAHAAKYGHCHVRYPVEYRTKVPFRPELAAPLDFAVRAEEVYVLDRELDRALLSPDDLEAILLENVAGLRGPRGLFRVDAAPVSVRPRSGHRRASAGGASLGPHRRQFLFNELRYRAQVNRFHPPWTVPLVQQAHTVLLSGLGLPIVPGELRETSLELPLASGIVAYRPCPPERIPAELQSLLDWVDRYGVTLMPLIPATVLLQGFYAIRPFPAGNMTVARALCDLYLRLFGLPNSSLAPIALATLERPEVLRRLHLWTESSGSHTEIIDFVVDATLQAYEGAVLRWLDQNGTDDPLEEVALRLLVRARRAPGWFSAREATRWVGGRSGATVLRHLNLLVDRGVLEALGQTRAKRYRFVSPLTILPDLTRRFDPAADEEPPRSPTDVGHRAPRRSPLRRAPE